MAVLPSQYLKSLQASLSHGQYSDLLLTCQGHKFPVHRIIVCSHSPVLKAACDGGFREAESRTIALDDDDLDSVSRMVSYMYTFDYNDYEDNEASEIETPAAEAHSPNEPESSDGKHAPVQEATDDDELFSSVRVYAIADKYGIASLKDLARERLKKWAENHWKSQHFPEMVSEVFSSTPDEDLGLRNVVVAELSLHVLDLAPKSAWKHVLESHGKLSAQLLTKLVDQYVTLDSIVEDQAENLQNESQRCKDIENQLTSEQFSSANYLRRLYSALNDREQCRYCAEAFNVEFDEKERKIRCRKCRTRHTV